MLQYYFGLRPWELTEVRFENDFLIALNAKHEDNGEKVSYTNMPILINETYAFLEEVKTKNVIKINDWEWRKLFIGYSGVLRLYQSSKEPSKHYILLKSPNGDYIRTGKGDFSIIDGKYVLSTINSLYTFVPYTKKMRKIIYRNVICCKHCNDIIESTFTHDYVECKCGRCSVDGGKDYLRRSFVEKDDFLELAVCLYADEKWNELTVDYKEIWNYIQNNPATWENDKLFTKE